MTKRFWAVLETVATECSSGTHTFRRISAVWKLKWNTIAGNIVEKRENKHAEVQKDTNNTNEKDAHTGIFLAVRNVIQPSWGLSAVPLNFKQSLLSSFFLITSGYYVNT